MADAIVRVTNWLILPLRRVLPPIGKVDKTFRWKLPVTGASKTKTYLASGQFPPGLSLDEVTGLLTGTPLQAGRYHVKFWVFGDSGAPLSKSYTVRVLA